jgi:hypothetical protein
MVYQNLTKTRTFTVEKTQGGWAIVEQSRNKKRTMATYRTQREAEQELTAFAYDGFRRVD